MSFPNNSVDRLQHLIELAEIFSERGQSSEAAQALVLALRLAPDSSVVKKALAQLRHAQRQGSEPAPTSTLEQVVWEELRRRALDGAHFLGLARLYEDLGQDQQAFECLEIAKAKSPANPGAHRLHGELLLQHGDASSAARELRRALVLDPFDRETAELLGLAEHQLRRFDAAAHATAHAFLLGRQESPEGERLRRRLQTLKRILGWGKAEVVELFATAREGLETARDRLEWHRERFLEEEILPQGGAWFGRRAPQQRGSRLSLASRLRKINALQALSDEQIFRLTDAVQEEMHQAGSLLFANRDEGLDFYFVEDGAVRLDRSGDYGTFSLRSVAVGEILGEMSWILRQPRTADAVAARPTRLLRLDAATLEQITRTDAELSQQLWWSMWHSLAAKLRAANEQLRAIFSHSLPQEALAARWRPTAAGEPIELAQDDKVRVLRDHGLSPRELATLATFSHERRFPQGSYLFREGEPGEALYAIVEGRVLISKFIPGGGDEALAVLGRGEFFGEMALVDGQPRSADARAEGGPVTILAVDRSTVLELLTLDPESSLDFLRLLCRLLARRLAEVDEKALGWQIISARQGDSPGSPFGEAKLA